MNSSTRRVSASRWFVELAAQNWEEHGREEELSDQEWRGLCDWHNVIPFKPVARGKRFRLAVQAAIHAYEQSGKMLDAALAYAAHGLPVFPLTINKTPVPPRDKDADGKPIPGTGGFKKATTDPIQIRAWWKGHEYLIGLPTGARTGVWCLDVDTSEDHADGVAAWNEIVARHTRVQQRQDPHTGQRYEHVVPAYDTREHRSATDGPHLIFTWDAAQPLGCSAGKLPDGISVKGEGGYIGVPPSRRKRRSYTVHRDIDPTDAPRWLLDLIGRTFSSEPYVGQITADLDEVAEATACIPNNDETWEEFKSMAMRIYAATNGTGYSLFDAWSRKSRKHNDEMTLEAWEQVQSSPPTRTGVEKIFKMAREHGWVRKGKPTYPLEQMFDADVARREIRRIVDDFLQTPKPRLTWVNVAEWSSGRMPPPPVWALCIDTGVGKTKIAIEAIAQWLPVSGKRVLYAVPHHRLSEKIDEQFKDHGINARVFYGRDYNDPLLLDPDKPKDQQVKMCLRPEAVALAIEIQADVTASCCKDGKIECPLKSRCGYFRQQEDSDAVQVWVVASDMLFHAQKVLGKPAVVVVDESIWRKGIRGVEDAEKFQVALDSLSSDDVLDSMVADDVRAMRRHQLAQALLQQEKDGGVERRHLETLSVADCNDALRLEWKYHDTLTKHVGLQPDTPDNTLATINKGLVGRIKQTRNIIRVWDEVRNISEHDDIAVSGRLTLRRGNVEWTGVASIRPQFKAPTLMLDATLPKLPVLQVYHPQAEIVAEIKVSMPPCVHIRQVVGAPTSSSKLISSRVTESERLRHLQAVQRYIIKRHIEVERQPTLVICQQQVELWLRDKLPPGIEIAHYNAISGIDIHRLVRLEILVGRTAPGPRAPERLAGVLTGRQPQLLARGSGYTGYPQVPRSIRLRNGSGHVIDRCDQHPDEFVEDVRWLICEAELVQALGRARAVNRDALSPLDVDILCDVVLPIVVDDVTQWRTPSELMVTASEGYMPTAPVDMMKVRPDLWASRRSATRCIAQGVPQLPGFVPVSYQLKGPKMKQRVAYFDLNIIPDPRAWLEQRLGPLVK